MTSLIPLRVNWNKQVIDLQLDPVMIGVKGLKEELHLQTGVPVSRMKLMAKSKGLWKGVLNDTFDVTSIDWKAALLKQSPLQLLLMGSAEKIQNEAVLKQKTVFLEDLPPELRAVHAEPAGLINLGNTCYLNSVVQCLRAVPELRDSLQLRNNNNSNNNNSSDPTKQFLVQSLRETYTQLDRQTDALPPAALVQAVKMVWPQFAQTTPQGHPMQQDAEEFYSNLLAALHELRYNIDDLFGLKMTETLTCNDIPEEPPVTKQDLHRKLTCNIQGGGIQADTVSSANSTAVNYVGEGILLGLKGEIEKHSDIAGRDCQWTRTQRIQSLPPIVTVQFGRFYWKSTPDSQDHAGVKCKIMKPVAFGDVLDMYDFCTPEIQKVLQAARQKALAAEEVAIQNKLQGAVDADGDAKMDAANDNSNNDGDVDDEEDMQKALAMSLEPTVDAADDDQSSSNHIVIGPGLPADFQGYYELFAVVTHKGRDADGGHYMAWVKSSHQDQKQKKISDTDVDNEDWFVFDDDEVSPCKTEDVLKLKGGGDWHMSYLNFYRVKK